MWNAMGNCYEKLNKKNEATRCYERAENGKDKEGMNRQFVCVLFDDESFCFSEGIALFQMGKLYDLMGFEERAIQCFEENLKRKDDEMVIDKELGECLMILANHYKKKANIDRALYFARRLQDMNGPERYLLTLSSQLTHAPHFISSSQRRSEYDHPRDQRFD